MPIMGPHNSGNKATTGAAGATGATGATGSARAADGTTETWTRDRIILHFIAPILAVTGIVLFIFAQAYEIRSGGQGEYPLPTAQIVAPTGTAAVPTATPTQGDNTVQPHAVIQGDDLAALLPTIEVVNCAAPATEGERSACNAPLSPAAVPVPQPAQPAYRPAVQPVLVSIQQVSDQAPAVLQSFAPMTSASQSNACNADGTQCSKSKPDRRP